MKGIFSIVSAAAISSIVLAQAAPEAVPTPEVASATDVKGDSPFSFKNFLLEEDMGFFDLGSNDITELNTKFSWELAENVDIKVNVPMFTNGNTGVGMVGIGLGIDAIKAPTTWIDAITISTGLELPSASDDFGGDSINLKVGVGAHGSTVVEKLEWCAVFDGTLVNDATFLPVFGGLVFDDVVHIGCGLKYDVCDGFDVALKYNYWDVSNGGSISTLGPTFNFDLCSRAKFEAGFDIPVADDNASDLDLVVRAGLNVKF